MNTFECRWLYVFYTPDRYFYAFPQEDHSQFSADITGDALFRAMRTSATLSTVPAMDIKFWKLEPPLPLESRRKLRVDGFFNDIAIPGPNPFTQLTYTRHGVSMHYIREPPLLGRDAFVSTANSLHFVIVSPEPNPDDYAQANPSVRDVPLEPDTHNQPKQSSNRLTRTESSSGSDQDDMIPTVAEDDSACAELRDHGFEIHSNLDDGFPYLANVWRVPNANIRFVAKKVPKHSKEVNILRRLNSLARPSDNIVELVDSFYGASGTLWAVFPKLPQSLDDCLHYCPPDYLSPHASSICESLVKVISHLHALNIAHQDIKPENILLTDDFILKLIDFGFAIEVRDENDQVRDLTGTKGWNPPEIEEGWPKHSPIKADRWACGNVVMYILNTCKMDGPRGLRPFATQLMSKSPHDRPPVSRWFDSQVAME